jgi:hypothetical protein
MYGFPNDAHIHKHRKYVIKNQRSKRLVQEANKPQKETFYGVVRKAKNVAIFAQNLKQRIAENRSLNCHSLNPKEMAYLETDTQEESSLVCFDHDNRIILGIEIVYIGTMLLYLWQCTFEIVFGEMPTNEIINGIALVFYFVHIGLFLVTEYKN